MRWLHSVGNEKLVFTTRLFKDFSFWFLPGVKLLGLGELHVVLDVVLLLFRLSSNWTQFLSDLLIFLLNNFCNLWNSMNFWFLWLLLQFKIFPDLSLFPGHPGQYIFPGLIFSNFCKKKNLRKCWFTPGLKETFLSLLVQLKTDSLLCLSFYCVYVVFTIAFFC